MADGSDKNGRFGETGVIELTGKIMVVAIVLLFFVVIFVFCLHLYAKWFWYRRQDTTTTMRRRRRLDFAAGHHETPVVSALRHGLDPLVLKTIPVIVFDPEVSKDGLECAVCLCEVSEGEKTRLLPKCNHGFHVECIDMWFQSHSTCPLCRNPVANGDECVEIPLDNVVVTEAVSFPTNVLIYGDETRVSTFGHEGNGVAETSSSSSSIRPDGVSIDIPRAINEEGDHDHEHDHDHDQKLPAPTRLRSLKRLLSGNRRVNPSSPRNLDIEQGGRS